MFCCDFHHVLSLFTSTRAFVVLQATHAVLPLACLFVVSVCHLITSSSYSMLCSNIKFLVISHLKSSGFPVSLFLVILPCFPLWLLSCLWIWIILIWCLCPANKNHADFAHLHPASSASQYTLQYFHMHLNLKREKTEAGEEVTVCKC